MFGRGAIVVDVHPGAPVIPATAMQVTDGKKYAYVVKSDKADRRELPFTDPATGNEYFINVRLADPFRSNVSDLADVFLRTPSGAALPLSNVARVERGSGPVTIARKYLQRIVDVTANVAPGKDLGSASDGVQKVLDDTPAPDGFNVELGGQTLAQRQASQGVGFAGLMALALVYMVLASQFNSLVDPLVIMFSVPLGISGVFAMLAATKTPLVRAVIGGLAVSTFFTLFLIPSLYTVAHRFKRQARQDQAVAPGGTTR